MKYLALSMLLLSVCTHAEITTGGAASRLSATITLQQIQSALNGLMHARGLDVGFLEGFGGDTRTIGAQMRVKKADITLIPNGPLATDDEIQLTLAADIEIPSTGPWYERLFMESYVNITFAADVKFKNPFNLTPTGETLSLQLCTDQASSASASVHVSAPFNSKTYNETEAVKEYLNTLGCTKFLAFEESLARVPKALLSEPPVLSMSASQLQFVFKVNHYDKSYAVPPTSGPRVPPSLPPIPGWP